MTIATQALTDIHRLAQRFAHSKPPTASPQINFPSPSPLKLPPSDSILARFHGRDVPPEVLDLCARSLTTMTQAICTKYEETWRSIITCGDDLTVPLQKLSSGLRNAFECAFERTVVHKLEHFVSVAEERTSKVLSRHTSTLQTKHRSSFNHEYTPVLEKYFECNAYPTALDRAVLAKNTNMSVRQIEVWFQNHRNRAKKDGRPLARPNNGTLPQNLTLQLLGQRKMDKSVEHRESSTPELDYSDYASQSSDDDYAAKVAGNSPIANPLLSPYAASWHTFPLPFSSSRHYQPIFEDTSSLKVSEDAWSRRPTLHTNDKTQDSTDVEQLAIAFSKSLTIHDVYVQGRRRKSRAKQPVSVPTRYPERWYAGRITVVPTAPLPAFSPTQTLNTFASNIASVQDPYRRNHIPKTMPARERKPYLPRRFPSHTTSSPYERFSTNMYHTTASLYRRDRTCRARSIDSANSECSSSTTMADELITPPSSPSLHDNPLPTLEGVKTSCTDWLRLLEGTDAPT